MCRIIGSIKSVFRIFWGCIAMKETTNPKVISDFAKEYQKTYIALTQYKSAYEIVLKERDKLKKEYSNMEIILLFDNLDDGEDDRFLAAYKFMPTKKELEIECQIDFTDLEYCYFTSLAVVEKQTVKWWLQRYNLK